MFEAEKVDTGLIDSNSRKGHPNKKATYEEGAIIPPAVWPPFYFFHIVLQLVLF